MYLCHTLLKSRVQEAVVYTYTRVVGNVI